MELYGFAKGHKFLGPDGMGYELTRQVLRGDRLIPSLFAPFGGAPEPAEGHTMPVWLLDQLRKVLG